MTKPIHEQEFAVIDVETTGANPAINSLISVAIVPLNDTKAVFSVFVRPDNPVWSPIAHKYFRSFESEWVKSAISPEKASEKLINYLRANFKKNVVLIGHNVGFDISFLRQLFASAGYDDVKGISHRSIDTHSLLFTLWKVGIVEKYLSSSDDAFSYFGIQIPKGKRHTALEDAIATRSLFNRAISKLASYESGIHAKVVE